MVGVWRQLAPATRAHALSVLERAISGNFLEASPASTGRSYRATLNSYLPSSPSSPQIRPLKVDPTRGLTKKVLVDTRQVGENASVPD